MPQQMIHNLAKNNLNQERILGVASPDSVCTDASRGIARPPDSGFASRRGARRIGEIPSSVLARLEAGEIETVNLMEWLATDMSALARNVAARARSGRLRSALEEAAAVMAGQGVIGRLKLAGRAIADTLPDFEGPDFTSLAEHASDLVRQWACYAVNHAAIRRSLAERLTLTLPFAADPNMSVREAAWMAFRPNILARVQEAIALLEPVSRDADQSHRRFAIEATRPRSVWGAHIELLKRRPEKALPLLDNVRQDKARYVQLAAGNWLNDASKSRPDWVAQTCARWSTEGNPQTAVIVRRGLRTLARRQGNSIGNLMDLGVALSAPP
jgi:3-methyladenine DNA glycosylase AlkC